MSDASTSKRGLPEQVKMRHTTHFVEDLAVRSETPVGRMIDLEKIEPDPSQPRVSMGDLSELVSSIEDKGVLEPILVRPHPDVGNSGRALFRIISGERRYQAALEAGLVEVPVIEMEVGEQEALEIALVENLQRKDLTPFEEGEGYRKLAEAHGYTHEEIASAVGKSPWSCTICPLPDNISRFSFQNFSLLSSRLGLCVHSTFRALRPWMAAQVESATTATPWARIK